jgi:hypothetical protein
MDDRTLVTINAELLEDKNTFSYRDIQQLCVRLELGGKGKREELVEKLKRWHRSRSPVAPPRTKELKGTHTRFTSNDEENETSSPSRNQSETSFSATTPDLSPEPLPMNVRAPPYFRVRVQ